MASDFLTYGSILIAIALGFIVAALVILYVRLLRETNKLREEKSRLLADAQKNAEEILAKAQRSAEQIIREANDKAANIIKSTEVLSQDSKNTMLAQLQKVAEQNMASFKSALESARSDIASVLSDVAKKLQGQAVAEVEAFKGILSKEIENSQTTLKEAVNVGYKKIEAEIGRYRQARIAQIDATIFEILREVTKNIIGRAISFEEHEELVKKSLEEAKRQNLFSEEGGEAVDNKQGDNTEVVQKNVS